MSRSRSATRWSPHLSPIGREALDSPSLAPAVTRATLKDIARANALFGGRAAVAYGVARLLEGEPAARPLRVLDAGAGRGDVGRDLARQFGGRRRVETVAIDLHRESARLCRELGTPAAVADAFRLPLGDRAVDIAVASQLLHHFTRPAAQRLARELTRVARVGVVVADLRRARLAAAGIWVAAHALRFHAVSRRDGVVSIRRGYVPHELAALLAEAGLAATVRRRPGYRLVATWRCDRAYA